MIKINLVAEGRRPVVARQAKGPSFDFSSEDLSQYMLLAGLLVGAIVVGTWWFLLNRTISSNQQAIARAEQQVKELEEIIRQVEEFEAKTAELELKIQVITDLKNNQRGPVRIMDEISKALPELLWLETLNQTGNNVSLTGRAFNANAVANFVENLDHVPEFQEPVLRDTREAGQVYTFTILFNFNITPPQVEEPAVASGG